MRPICHLALLPAFVLACGGGADDPSEAGAPPSLTLVGPDDAPQGVEVVWTVTIDDEDPETVELTATASDGAILAHVAVEGSGAQRTVRLRGAAVGATSVRVEATDVGGQRAVEERGFEVYRNRQDWTGVTRFTPGANATPQDLTVTPDGEVAVVGHWRTTRYHAWVVGVDTAGEEAWSLSWAARDGNADAIGRAITALADGTVLLAAQAKTLQASNEQTLALVVVPPDRSGIAELLSFSFWTGHADYSAPTGIEATSDGGFALAGVGRQGNEYIGAAMRYNAEGEPVLDATLLLGASEISGRGLATHGASIAVAYTSALAPLDSGLSPVDGVQGWVSYYDPDAERAWVHPVGGAGTQEIAALGRLSDGAVIACGTTSGALQGGSALSSGSAAWVRKIDVSGATVWTRVFESGGLDRCERVAIGRNNTIYAGGTWARDGMVMAGFVVALDADGEEVWFEEIQTVTPSFVTFEGMAFDGRDLLVLGNANGQFDAPGTPMNRPWLARIGEDGRIR